MWHSIVYRLLHLLIADVNSHSPPLPHPAFNSLNISYSSTGIYFHAVFSPPSSSPIFLLSFSLSFPSSSSPPPPSFLRLSSLLLPLLSLLLFSSSSLFSLSFFSPSYPPFPPPLFSPHIHSLAITLYSCTSRGLFIFDILNVAQYFSLQST